MSSPVDIKAVLDAMGDAEEARNKPIRIHVYLDETAPIDLVNIAFAATRAITPNATVLHDPFPERNAIPDASANMAVVVAGDSAESGRLYRELQGVGVPTIVMAASRDVVAKRAIDAGFPIAAEDIVAPSTDSNPKALNDRSANAPIGLDSTDAQQMLDSMARWIISVFKDLRLAFAYALPYVRKPLAKESVDATAIQNAGIGVVAIIPGADLPLMTLNQVKMLLEIAAAYGEELSLGRIKEILAIVGGALACRGIARQVVGVVPGIGWVVKGGIGYAGTIAMGKALVDYFESGANVGVTAQDAAASLKRLPQWLGISKDKGIAENVQLVTGAVGDAVSSAASSAVRNIGPAATAVANAASNATGFSKDDIVKAAGKLGDAVKGRLK